ncbi:MAG: glycine cleavage T C-terminal barrel domain-containing protein, partial [Bacteroidales bacterium]
ITKFVDDKSFVNREFLEKQKQEGLKRKLAGFKLLEKGIPRKDYAIENKDGHQIGIVTSGSISPVLNCGIGMGYLKPEFCEPGTTVYIRIRNRAIPAMIEKMPFRK